MTLRLVYEAPQENKHTLPLPSTLSPYVVPKGYITLDGTSLTLIDVSPPNGGALGPEDPKIPAEETLDFTVMLIPHTQEHIVLPSKKIGDAVNVEFDMVGKYVYRSILGQFQRLDAQSGGDGALSSTMLDRLVQRSVNKIR
ncbi:riboflavin synthase [Malassezia yamatoensis]|uniref:Riboflavin synthase n=1 Tax=Malassezia yamatoensis TaxID=253288 RepID=A0AAJ5YNP7_9BASI|nr:riboflavin synthase [Malassezia yamatoensis]